MGFFLFGQFTTSKGCTAAPAEKGEGEMDDHDTQGTECGLLPI